MFVQIAEYLKYPIVRNALIVGIMIALSSSLFGPTLVLKRLSFIGDGLSHVAFGAMSVAAVLGLSNDMIAVLPITVIAAVLLMRRGNDSGIKGDALIAMISVGSLSVGYLLMNMFSKDTANISGDICSSLFGSTSILTLSEADVILSLIMSAAVVTLFILFYNRIFAVTFDEDFARASGTKTEIYELMTAAVTAVVIVLAMKLVGSLLISAFLIFPALSAMRLFNDFKLVTIFSAVQSVVCTALGILISVLAGTPVGAMIVAVNISGFIICSVLGKLLNRGN